MDVVFNKTGYYALFLTISNSHQVAIICLVATIHSMRRGGLTVLSL